ncbi:hypothetical protein EDB89DRAFT_2065580 [Lactarius sanguifluus]|nr:hypothetical protein EDB89DRAFT_2065580 [Lactarius sanguifluus]
MRATLVLLTLFELAQSAQIYLHPPTIIWGSLPPPGSPRVGPLITGDIDKEFVGQGPSSGLLIGIDDADAEYTVPVEDLRNSTRTFFSNVFDGSNSSTLTPSPLLDTSVSPTETFDSELSALVEFLEADHLSIRDAYGRDSEEYTTAVGSLKDALRSAADKPHLHLVILTYPGVQAGVQKRQDQSPLPPDTPPPPVGSDTLCFVSEEICSNSTDSCSGHASKDDGRTEYWAGSKCERKDVSGPFVLITGTVVALILIIVGSISLLSSVGNQPLPSVLTSSVPGMSARE